MSFRKYTLSEIIKDSNESNTKLKIILDKVKKLIDKAKVKCLTKEQLEEEVDKIGLKDYGDIAWIMVLFLLIDGK